MARVYRAFHLGLERPCALKIMNPSLKPSRATSTSRCSSPRRAPRPRWSIPNIVTVHNIGDARELHYIEMEFVDGESPSRLLEQRQLDATEATGIMMQIVAGLSEAHAKEIVHRDLKPGNVLLSPDGVAKLADFGLAKRVVGAEDTIAGTPHFMAPELFEGRAASRESDIYAAGVSFYYLLTGKLPYVAQSLPGVAERHRTAPVPDARELRSDVPEQAAEIVRVCLAKDPDGRYAHGQELHAALSGLLGRLRRLDTLLQEALPEMVVQPLGGEMYGVVVPVADGRQQRVIIDKQEDLVRVSSLCAEVRDDYVRRALELNASLSHGAVAIREHDGRPFFVMTDVYPLASCDAMELRRTVLAIAESGDAVERTLTGRDVF